MLFTDVKYLKLVSYRIQGFKIKKDTGNTFLANCRCPICGDSEKNSKKLRGYFYSRGTKLLYKCHNCNASLSFSKWLKDFDFNVYSLYALEDFQNKTPYQTISNVDEKIPQLKTKPYRPSVLTELKSIIQLDDVHPVRKYITGRKIPEKYWGELYYAPKFFKWTLGHTDKFKNVDEKNDHPRLIIPFFTQDTKEVFMYHARAFGDEKPKYFSIKLDKKPAPFYGLDRMNKDDRVYVVEGPIDSLFLPNSVAIGSSALHTFDLDVEKTFVVDNENRNREILKEYKRLINLGVDLFIPPDTYTFKDINDAVEGGMEILDIKSLIDQNTYNGLAAEMRFNQWMRRDL